MMAKPLASGFKLVEGNLGNSDEILQVMVNAFEEDAIWEAIFKNCKKEDVHSWAMNVFPQRWKLPDVTLYMITEESTGYDCFQYFLKEWKANCSNRKIAGWTALYFPWANYPLKEEELAIVNSPNMPPGIEGMNMEALPTFFERLNLASKYGYDPNTDYRKKSSLQSPRKPVL